MKPISLRQHFKLSLLAVCVAGFCAATAQARPPQWVAQAQESRANAPALTADQAARIVRARTGGRVLSVQFSAGRRPVYRVKVLVSGERVRTLRVDARTGTVLD